ncbi:RICIN domain-containing protein [Mucilaginibacter sp. P19]|uniref:RICIN domain-containing protein n=1 Tax=Mucilaginibacter sp. P19 TaxID=3423947 RepID=UPI003D67593D
MKTNLFTCTMTAMALLASCSKQAAVKYPKPFVRTDSVQLTSGSPVSSYGTFFITNVLSGKAIEINSNGMLNDGTGAQQNQYSGSGTATAPNQKWIIVQQGGGAITSTTKFKIMNVASGKYLEVPLATTNPGTGLWQDKANTNNAQQWYIQAVSTGVYKIINVGNGLAVTNHGSSATNGTPITQEVFVAGNTAQTWLLNGLIAEAYRDDDVVNFFTVPMALWLLMREKVSRLPMAPTTEKCFG